MDTFWLWVGFAMGLAIRWADRAQFIVGEEPERTWSGYFKKNWLRLALRTVTTLYIFRLILAQGWVTTEFIAFSVGVSFEALSESLVERARKLGGEAVQRMKNGNGKPPESA